MSRVGKHVGIPIPPIKSNFFLPTQKLYEIRQGFYGGLPISDELLFILFTESICSIDKYVGRLLLYRFPLVSFQKLLSI